MLTGTYVFFVDGEEVARQKNILTVEGKKIIASYLAGATPAWAGAIALGVGRTAATTADAGLNFEFYRALVKTGAVNFGGGVSGAHRIILKAEIDTEVVGLIEEVGLYPDDFNGQAGKGQSSIVSYGDSTEAWEEYDGADWLELATTPVSTFTRVGEDSISLSGSSGTGKFRFIGAVTDFSAYSPNDTFSFAMIKNTGSGTPTNIEIRFTTSAGNYYAYSPSVASLIGADGVYKISTFTKSNWIATGSPSWADIASIGFYIDFPGATNILVDSFRVDDVDTNNPDFALVSRTVLSTAVAKEVGRQMDIEYYLDLAL